MRDRAVGNNTSTGIFMLGDESEELNAAGDRIPSVYMVRKCTSKAVAVKTLQLRKRLSPTVGTSGMVQQSQSRGVLKRLFIQRCHR
jgi:hypothetical protein